MHARAIALRLKEELARLYGQRLVEVVLYGSCTRGEQGEDSDVDVVVVLQDEPEVGTEIERMGHLVAHLNLEHGILLSVLPTSLARWEEASGPFWRNIRKEGVPV